MAGLPQPSAEHRAVHGTLLGFRAVRVFYKTCGKGAHGSPGARALCGSCPACLSLKLNVPFHPDFRNELVSALE